MRFTSASLSSVALLALLAPAEAATPEETLVRSWLEAAALGVPITVKTSTFDPALDAVLLEGVTIGGPGHWLTVGFQTLTVTDPRTTASGQFAAHAIRGEQMRVEARIDFAALFPDLAKAAATPPSDEAGQAPGTGAEVTTNVPKPFDVIYEAEIMLAERVVLQLQPPALPKDASVITTAFAYARASLSNRADWFEVDNVTVTTKGLETGDSTSSYDLIYLTGLHDGRVERSGYSNFRQTAGTAGATQSYSVETGYLMGFDGRAVIEVLDPQAASTGIGPWRTIVQQQGVQNVTFEIDDVTAKIGSAEANAIQVRRTEKSLVALVEPILKNPDVIEKAPEDFIRDFFPNVFGLYRLNSVAVDNIEITAKDGAKGTLGEIDVTDVDSNGIGAITLRRGEITVDETSSGKFGLFTINNIRFGSWKPMADLIAFGAENPEADPPAALMKAFILESNPSTDFMELNGVEVKTPVGDFVLDVFTATAGDYLGTLATRGDIAFTKAAFPVSVITDPSVQDELKAMGYEEISISGGLSYSWDHEKGLARIDDLTTVVFDMGRLSMDAVVSGVPLSLLDDLSTIESRLQEVALVGASLRFGNASIVERTFEAQAKKLNQDPARFRDDFANALPLMLGFLEDKEIQTRFQDVLKVFFKDPKSLVLSVKPTAPLPFTAMEALGQDGSGPLLKALNLTVEANK